MDERRYRFSPMRVPLTDATNTINNRLTPKRTQEERSREETPPMTSPQPMSIVTSPMSTKGPVDINCLSPTADSMVESNRNSTVSAASIVSNKGKRKTHVGPWQLGRTLGRGATGRVRLAKHAMTGQTAAIKIVSKKSAAIAQSESIAAMDKNVSHYQGTGGAKPMPSGIEREVVIMKLIEHPNVISLYDVWENRGELYLVLEYVEGGELFDYVSNHGPLPEEEAVRLFRQIIAGLGYCHRFNICHRDLKPENILLDSWHNVKLADFGMAALQPAGHWLNTSCGSPHYAAPEIIYGRKYRGDKADIWSCGIILYALLTGYLPFDGGDLPSTLRLVKRGDYIIPSDISEEATDLIQRILQKKPEDRITMQNMWMHPLMKKYEKLHQAMANHYIGPAPPLSIQDCGSPVISRQDIDVDLLRNLQTLWHDVKPDMLVDRLLNPDPTYERMFYNALVKFRNEQLENYQGQPLEYSASDYHHISRPNRNTPHKLGHGRTPSNSRRRHHLAVKDSNRSATREPKSSGAESYDPYRSPKNRVSDQEPEYAQVTIHRKASGIRKKNQSIEALQLPKPVPEEEAEDEEDVGCPPSSPFAVVRNNKRTKVNSVKSFQSRTSQTSARRHHNASQAPRSASYKRNVSFRHVRQRSQGSTSKARPPQTKAADLRQQPSETSIVDPSPVECSSPLLPAQPTVVRGAGVTVRNSVLPKRSRNSEFIWKEDDARKVSHELSQICEEAFNGGSLSTNCTTSTCLDPETPATSVGLGSPEASQPHIAANATKQRQSQGPGTAPRSYTAAELAETRRKLIAHSTQDGCENIPDYLVAVIGHLDRLIEQDAVKKKEQRENSEVTALPPMDPFGIAAADAGSLPMISEEINSNLDAQNPTKAKQEDNRTVSETTLKGPPPVRNLSPEKRQTIRMVPQSSLQSMAEIKPLNIRKKGRDVSGGDSEKPSLGNEPKETSSIRFASVNSRQSRNICELDPIHEVNSSPRRNNTRTSENKKWSWFRSKSTAPTVPQDNTPKEIRPLQPSNGTVIVHEIQPSVASSAATQAEQEKSKQESGKEKSSFFKRLIKRKPSKSTEKPAPEPHHLNISAPIQQAPPQEPTPPVERDNSNSNSNSNTDTQKPLPRKPQTTGKSQNLFARLFQFKPATRVIALNASKMKSRKDVYKLLREWRQFGMDDVYLDKANSVIHGKVGETNFLRLRPVEFSAEFCTILEHGRQANLSVVRFKQERGAASSFHKVVDTLYMVMKQRGMVVEDRVRAKKMAGVMDAFPQT